MTDGEILKQFIDNQSKSKVSIAKDLGISKQTLFQYFRSRDLEKDTKKKFEQYFGKQIFILNGVSNSTDTTITDPANDALIQMLILEIAKIKSKMYGISVDDAIDELEKNARIALRQVQKS